MNHIMNIQDVFEAPTKGIVVGGINHELDGLSAAEIKNRIGKKVKFYNPSGSTLEAEVIDVEVSSSLIDQKNIYVLLSSSTATEELERGATMCS